MRKRQFHHISSIHMCFSIPYCILHFWWCCNFIWANLSPSWDKSGPLSAGTNHRWSFRSPILDTSNNHELHFLAGAFDISHSHECGTWLSMNNYHIVICIKLQNMNVHEYGGTPFMLLEHFTKHPSRSTANHISKSVLCGRCGTIHYHPLSNQ